MSGSQLDATQHRGAEYLELERAIRTWMAFSTVSIFCVTTFCLGLIAALLCNAAGKALARGQLEDARSKLLWTKVATLFAVLLALATYVAGVLVWLTLE